MTKPDPSSPDWLVAITALVVQFGLVYGISWFGWWALQPIFPALDYPRFGVGAAALYMYLRGLFNYK